MHTMPCIMVYALLRGIVEDKLWVNRIVL